MLKALISSIVIIIIVGKLALNDNIPFLNPFDPIVEGNNTCYMATGYYPKEELTSILPNLMTIPSDEQMSAHYPDVELKDGFLPFMLSFCHGAYVHDVYTKHNVPQQEELMFVIPVLYDDKHMMSYPPVLYLNSSEGVVGGLYYGLRKEYHSEM